jgi:hypothetical protein
MKGVLTSITVLFLTFTQIALGTTSTPSWANVSPVVQAIISQNSGLTWKWWSPCDYIANSVGSGASTSTYGGLFTSGTVSYPTWPSVSGSILYSPSYKVTTSTGGQKKATYHETYWDAAPGGTAAYNSFPILPGSVWSETGLTLVSAYVLQCTSQGYSAGWNIGWKNETSSTITMDLYVIFVDIASQPSSFTLTVYSETTFPDGDAGVKAIYNAGTVTINSGVTVYENIYGGVGTFLAVIPTTSTTKKVTVAATLSPKGGYRYWLKAPASPTKIAVTISK